MTMARGSISCWCWPVSAGKRNFRRNWPRPGVFFPETDNFYNYVFTQVEFRNAMQYRRLTPELQKRCQRAVEARAVAPAIVTDNLPGKK